METILEEKEEVKDNEMKGLEKENEVQNEKQPKKPRIKMTKRKKIIAIIAIILVFIIVIGFAINSQVKKKKRLAEEERIRIELQENEYRDKISITIAYMLTNTYGCSSYATAYLELLSKYSVLGSTAVKNTLKANSEKLRKKMNDYDAIVVENMQWLNSNKVDKYAEVYNVLLDMYDNYRVFYDDTIDLSSSITSSNSSSIKKGEAIIEKYNRILIIMPDLKDGIESQKENLDV